MEGTPDGTLGTLGTAGMLGIEGVLGTLGRDGRGMGELSQYGSSPHGPGGLGAALAPGIEGVLTCGNPPVPGIGVGTSAPVVVAVTDSGLTRMFTKAGSNEGDHNAKRPTSLPEGNGATARQELLSMSLNAT